MKISFTCDAHVYDESTDELVTNSVVLRNLSAWSVTDEDLYLYLDKSLVDIGIVGGTMRLKFFDEFGLQFCTEYWSPRSLSTSELDELRNYSLGQWSDGIGECGFELQAQELTLRAFPGNTVKAVTQEDDGRIIPEPSIIAISARDGEIEKLKEAIDSGFDINSKLQGYTGLQLALLYGKAEAAMLLIENGANTNELAPDGISPMQACALSNALADEDCAILAKELLLYGADIHYKSSTGDTARSYAENRNKQLMLNAMHEGTKK